MAERSKAVLPLLLTTVTLTTSPVGINWIDSKASIPLRALGGRLVNAAMRIEDATDQMPFQLKTHWDELGRPSRTVLELRPNGTIDTRYRMAWTIAQGVDSLVHGGLPLAELCSGARGLAIDAEHVRVVLSGPLEDPSREMERVAALVRVGHRLSGRAGVYR